MKNYTITVNGNVYDVTVEEGTGSAAAPAAKAAPKAAPKAAKKAAPASAQGAVKVTAPMQGKILKTPVAAGSAVKKGDVLVVLEAMIPFLPVLMRIIYIFFNNPLTILTLMDAVPIFNMT